VSVVIFLCGVLVGRGVRADAMGATTPDPVTPAPLATSSVQTPPVPPSAAPPTPADGQLSYPDRLQRDKPPAETLKPPAAEAPTSGGTAPPAAGPASTPPAAQAPPVASATGAKPGIWVVQIVSLRDRAAASVIVDRLTSKGYPAFLVNPVPGAPVQSYKVQVGRYDDRHEAELVASRLKKEEQFEPWVLR
jgi:DedD protein